MSWSTSNPFWNETEYYHQLISWLQSVNPEKLTRSFHTAPHRKEAQTSGAPSEDQDLAPLVARVFFYVVVVHWVSRDSVLETPTLFSPDPQSFTNVDNFGGLELEIGLYGYLEKWTR